MHLGNDYCGGANFVSGLPRLGNNETVTNETVETIFIIVCSSYFNDE